MIALLKCLLFVIFMIVIGSAAGRLMQWTLMICFSILFCYFITIPKCWQGIRSYFVMSLLMSIKTQIMRSTAYCVN